MNNDLPEFGNFKFERVKKLRKAFPDVREYRTDLFGFERVVVSMGIVNGDMSELMLTFTGMGQRHAIVITFELSTKQPEKFYGFRCELVTFTRRNFMYGGNIKSLEKFVSYLHNQWSKQQNENMDSQLFSERSYSKSHRPSLHPLGGLHAPLLADKASGSR